MHEQLQGNQLTQKINIFILRVVEVSLPIVYPIALCFYEVAIGPADSLYSVRSSMVR